MINNFENSQQDMRTAYGFGSTGILSSGLVWLASAIAVNQFGVNTGIWTLIIGGMMIFPLSVLIAKLAGIRGSHDSNNPLGKSAMEGTVWMIMCIPLAFGLSLVKPEWFYQGMLLIIGGRYLTFTSLYGLKVYWLLGGMLAATATLLFVFQAGAFYSALSGGIIEVVLGAFLFVKFKKRRTATACERPNA